jgi:signal transduction histidine kinase
MSIAATFTPSLSLQRALTRRWRILALAAVALAGFLLFLSYYRSPARGLPYRVSFASASAAAWSAYGGTWEVVNGSMQNDSDDRGAKLLMGSPFWRDYSFDADIQLLGLGDAGILARAKDAELGVDAYNGYYAGLRTMDNSLVLGYADHGWAEYPPVPMPGGVQPFHWYHIMLAVSGCRILAVAIDRVTGARTQVNIHPAACAASGRIGLRSYTSGGVWRNISVTPLKRGAAPAPLLLGDLPPADASSHQRSLLAEYVWGNTTHPAAEDAGSQAQPISSLRFVSPVNAGRARVRGVVILTAPKLYVEDHTGGIAVEPSSSPALKIGDEVEVSGLVEPHAFSSVLKAARVRLLWEAAPDPPLSITANQAASGAFDAMFIQTEGRLKERPARDGNTVSLDLEREQQEFRAVLNAGRSAPRLSDVYPGSTLRLRGICTSDPRWTRNLTPFVLLVRSASDISVIAGPPWWSWSTLIPFAVIALVFIGAGYHVLVLARHWRLQAILEERSRLAHEIHDTLAQSFAGISFQLQAIRTSMPPNQPILEEQVRVACDLVRHSHEEARRGIARLRPESLQDNGLLPALQAAAAHMVGSGKILVKARREGNAVSIPLRISDTLFRIGQEAIANAVQHADASVIRISAVYHRSTLRLSIEDDGCGFDAEAPHGGFGLVGMKERARSIDAQLAIVSRPGAGTRVEVVVHLPVTLSLKNCYLWLCNACRKRKPTDSHSYC